MILFWMLSFKFMSIRDYKNWSRITTLSEISQKYFIKTSLLFYKKLIITKLFNNDFFNIYYYIKILFNTFFTFSIFFKLSLFILYSYLITYYFLKIFNIKFCNIYLIPLILLISLLQNHIVKTNYIFYFC
jgi:hypothetical protein